MRKTAAAMLVPLIIGLSACVSTPVPPSSSEATFETSLSPAPSGAASPTSPSVGPSASPS